MGWWKCSNSIYFTDVVSALSKNQGRYAAGKTIRPFIFIRLLDYTSENVIFTSYEHLSNMTSQQAAQCQIVWDTCIKHNVLRKYENGYSAREWMQEQGLLPEEQNQIIASSQPEQPKRQYEAKEQVRPNVRLSRKEIEELKKDYSDEEITRILDKLSDYKSSSGRNYSSDYQAIRKWVYKTLEAPEKKKPEIIEYPDWIFGIKEGTNDKG